MTMTITARRYSKALLEVAQEQNKLEEVLAEVEVLEKIVQDSQLTAFFKDAVYSNSDKQQVLENLKTGLSALTTNFLNTVAGHGRLAELHDMLVEVKDEANELFQIGNIQVTTAVGLTDAQKEKLSALTKQKFDLKEVTITNSIDEKIIGGFVINSRGKIIDASIKSQLAKIAKTLV